MEILNFIKSFNTLNTYLILAITVLIFIISFFYFINPI
ncbi:hypothetical protein PYR74_13460 [Acinetobacter bereziniae]|uniref:Uncharacterized protein n=1 Tax=Acinetobacter bereziniae TaxID=106648 RepID=A0A9E7PFI7_ACIBZ|nr:MULTISPECIES: hypothetical protein [Acinetobacter]MEC8122602.1 hypothetical protein [Pseudomonadota bacterium]ELW77691.1 hypothetical protein ACINWC743_2369 [Acinetobacter sp. WC-743]MCV2443634.1 hypothetical protein [Acinetobacter bereziniae]MDA3442209.1 hypothetical protein [Acinetobacter bereziniae]MDG3558280.1 hypothetical protein [Acinetobacter bereziniae]